MNIEEFIKSVEQLEKEKGIPSETIISFFEQSIASGYQREYKDINKDAIFRAAIDQENFTVSLWTMKVVVEEVAPGCESFEINLADAKAINPEAKIDEEIEVPVSEKSDLSRMAITYAKQIFIQKLKEAEKQAIFSQYSDKIGEIITAVVEKVEPNYVTVDLGKTFAVLKKRDLIPNELLTVGQHIRVFINNVEGSNGSHINVSRSDSGLVRRLFEQEIHEVYEGTIVIKAIVREAGVRTKVAVMSTNPNIDATGSCIGQRGARIINISNQINGEKIDVFEYIDDAALFILEAIKPASGIGLMMDEASNTAIIFVKNDDLSLAIGKGGFNIRLASKITGWNLEVKTDAWAKENDVEYVSPEALRLAYYEKKKEKVRLDLEKRELIKEGAVAYDETSTYEAYAKAVESGDDEEEAETDDSRLDSVPEIEPVKEEIAEVAIKEDPKVEEEVIEKVKIKGGRSGISLSDLERQMEEARQNKQVKSSKKKSDKEDNKKKIDDDEKARQEELARTYMPIYTEEELAQLEAEEDEDDDFDADEYDIYEDE